MMRNVSLILSMIILIINLSACKKIKGAGDLVTESRSVTGYTAIDLSIEEDVFFTPDSVYSLSLEGQQNILDIIETQVEGNSLVIKIKDHYTMGNHEAVKVIVHAPGISKLAVNGSGSFFVQSSWAGDALRVGISGSGDMNLGNIQARQFQSNISGSGSIHGASGMTDILDLTISGSGNMDFREMESDSVYANISGSGDITVWAIKMLEGTISGSGNIYYKGTPAIYSDISGSGTIRPI